MAQNLAHMVPINLVARLLGEYILNHSAMYDSYDFGPFCICWAEYFANKCIETQEAQIELQDQLDLDPGKASSLLQDSGDAKLRKLPTKERKKLDIAAGGHFACIVDVLIKRLMSNVRYADSSNLQPLAQACLLNSPLIVELMVRQYCDTQSVVSALEQLICLDDERPARLLLDILLATDFGKSLSGWQKESLHYHAELFNHTAILAKVLLLARVSSDGGSCWVLIKEVYCGPYRSLIQTVPVSGVVLIPQAERLVLQGRIEIIDSLVKALDKHRKKLCCIRLRDYEDTQRSMSLLQLAARKNFGQFVELLLIREQWPELCIKEAFLEAVECCHVEIVKIFFNTIPHLSNLSYLAQIDQDNGGELTHSLVSYDQLLQLFAKKFLCDSNVNWQYAEELMEMACSNGMLSAVKFLLPIITDISDRELRLDILSSCLNSACEYGNQEEAKCLLAAGASCNKRECVRKKGEVLHPFYMAVSSENFVNDDEKVMFIEYLLNKGAKLIEEEVVANLQNETIDMDDLFIVMPLFIKRLPWLAHKIMNSPGITIRRRFKLLTLLFNKYKEQLGSLISEIADVEEILALAQNEFEDFEGKEGLVSFLANLKAR